MIEFSFKLDWIEFFQFSLLKCQLSSCLGKVYIYFNRKDRVERTNLFLIKFLPILSVQFKKEKKKARGSHVENDRYFYKSDRRKCLRNGV